MVRAMQAINVPVLDEDQTSGLVTREDFKLIYDFAEKYSTHTTILDDDFHKNRIYDIPSFSGLIGYDIYLRWDEVSNIYFAEVRAPAMCYLNHFIETIERFNRRN
jgi:hypothetical protein